NTGVTWRVTVDDTHCTTMHLDKIGFDTSSTGRMPDCPTCVSQVQIDSSEEKDKVRNIRSRTFQISLDQIRKHRSTIALSVLLILIATALDVVTPLLF